MDSKGLKIVRVPRSFSLKFMGDIYNYETLQHAVTVKGPHLA